MKNDHHYRRFQEELPARLKYRDWDSEDNSLETKAEKSKRMKAEREDKANSPGKATAKRMSKSTASRKTGKNKNSKNAKALDLMARRAP
jgi:hypothetical protein